MKPKHFTGGNLRLKNSGWALTFQFTYHWLFEHAKGLLELVYVFVEGAGCRRKAIWVQSVVVVPCRLPEVLVRKHAPLAARNAT